jgi:hypothetical protein
MTSSMVAKAPTSCREPLVSTGCSADRATTAYFRSAPPRQLLARTDRASENQLSAFRLTPSGTLSSPILVGLWTEGLAATLSLSTLPSPVSSPSMGASSLSPAIRTLSISAPKQMCGQTACLPTCRQIFGPRIRHRRNSIRLGWTYRGTGGEHHGGRISGRVLRR